MKTIKLYCVISVVFGFTGVVVHILIIDNKCRLLNSRKHLRDEWPSGLYSLCQVTEVKLGRMRSDSRWVTSEA